MCICFQQIVLKLIQFQITLVLYQVSASARVRLAMSSYWALTSATIASMSRLRLLSISTMTDVSLIWLWSSRSSWIIKNIFFLLHHILTLVHQKNVSLRIVTKKCYLKKIQRIHRMQAFFKSLFIGREDKTMSFNWFLTYLLIDWPEEVDFICQTLKLGLQLNLIHVGLIYILETI